MILDGGTRIVRDGGTMLIRLAAALLAMAALAGCAEWQAGAAGIHSEGVKMLQNANDDALVLEREAMCATPYSALVRNVPKVAGLGIAVNALCGSIPAVPVVTPTAPAGSP